MKKLKSASIYKNRDHLSSKVYSACQSIRQKGEGFRLLFSSFWGPRVIVFETRHRE